MDENLPTRNNNPGDLRLAGQVNASPGAGGFASFPTRADGDVALLNQLQTNINKSPNESLDQWAGKYAPSSDGNDPDQYAVNVANSLGVAPNAPIGTLEPKIGQWADAVSKQEGASISQAESDPTGLGGAVSSVGHDVNQIPGGPATAVAGAGLVGGALALGGDVLGAGEGLLSGAGNLVKGGLTDIGLGSLFGGGDSSNTSTPTTPTQTYTPTPTSQAVDNVISQTVGGNATQQEAQKRNLGTGGQILEQNGLVPSVDENGNYEKMAPTLIANANIANLAEEVSAIAHSLPGNISISDMEKSISDEVDTAMKDTGESESTKAQVKKRLTGLLNDRNAQGGTQLSSSQMFLSPEDVLNFKRKVESDNNRRNGAIWALPPHERTANQLIKTGLAKHLSKHAHKHHKGKEWDKKHKKMEELFLAKKFIKSLPKKAQRDFSKELRHELVGALGGALIGKTLGNGLLGGIAGGLIERKLGKKHYKQLSKQMPQKSLVQVRQAQ